MVRWGERERASGKGRRPFNRMEEVKDLFPHSAQAGVGGKGRTGKEKEGRERGCGGSERGGREGGNKRPTIQCSDIEIAFPGNTTPISR